MKLLTIKQIEESDFDDASKKLYIDAMKAGADIVLLGESEDGYDVGIVFMEGVKH
jgi:hypothetical protein